MTEKAPPSPPGDPAIEQMAERLATLVPEDDRARARELLIDDILPVQLADLSSHPRPDALAQAVYDRLAADIEEAPDGGELDALIDRAWRSKLTAIDKLALSLAIARYLQDHPAAADASKVGPWITPRVSRWRGEDRDALVQEAAAAAQRLDELEKQMQETRPTMWNQLRASARRTRMALGSTRTGSFATAAGPLADFLRAAGQAHDTLDIH